MLTKLFFPEALVYASIACIARVRRSSDRRRDPPRCQVPAVPSTLKASAQPLRAHDHRPAVCRRCRHYPSQHASVCLPGALVSAEDLHRAVPSLVAPFARKTTRLWVQLQRNGFALGGDPGSRHAAATGMPVSARTLLRLVRAAPLPPIEPVVALGVDDWSQRKGHIFGTILVNLEAHKVIDLLPDRTADSSRHLARDPVETRIRHPRPGRGLSPKLSDVALPGACKWLIAFTC